MAFQFVQGSRRGNLGLPGRVDEVERDVGGLERGAGAVDGDDEEAAGLEQAVEGPERGAQQGGGVRQPPEVLRVPVPHDPPERLAAGRIPVQFIEPCINTWNGELHGGINSHRRREDEDGDHVPCEERAEHETVRVWDAETGWLMQGEDRRARRSIRLKKRRKLCGARTRCPR